LKASHSSSNFSAHNSLRHYPLGETWPRSPHAVIGSIPTMAAVIGYEERDPATMESICIGYPRFVKNPFSLQLETLVRRENAIADDAVICLLHADADVSALIADNASGIRVLPLQHGCKPLVIAPERDSVPILKRLRNFGYGISSRLAEDSLVAAGVLPHPFNETYADPSATPPQLAAAIGCPVDHCFPASCGMSAFYAAFRTVQSIQRQRGRNHWAQLGWLYVDSGVILDECLDPDQPRVSTFADVLDLNAVEEWLARHADSVAGIVVEAPTNPLLQVVDLPRLYQAVKKVGGILIVDPTVASIYAFDVLAHCDCLVTSLTKYAGWSADLLYGVCAVNPDSQWASALRDTLPQHVLKPHQRDSARLASLLPSAAEKTAQMCANAAAMAAYLTSHPKVEGVWYAGSADYAANSQQLQRKGFEAGGMVTLTVRGELSAFYDTLQCLKGPSFGVTSTVACPFLYLAHYELVTTASGRQRLANWGLPPELIRVSFGCEPIESLRSVFDQALRTL
jgi:cystathionine gamma-synthase